MFDFAIGRKRLVASRPHHLQAALRHFSSSAGDLPQPSSATDDGQGLSCLFRSLSGVVLAASAAAFFWPSPAESYSHSHLASQEDTGIFRRKEPRYIFGEAYMRSVFFNYEKRIRLRSSPEKKLRMIIGWNSHKVFEYFASYRNPKGEFMTAADLMCAIVPVFPPSESVNSSMEAVLIQIENLYIFFVTLLSIPESSFSAAFKMFDLNNNGCN